MGSYLTAHMVIISPFLHLGVKVKYNTIYNQDTQCTYKMYITHLMPDKTVNCQFESRSGQTKDYKIGICCFSVEQEKEQSKDWLAQNRDNVS